MKHIVALDQQNTPSAAYQTTGKSPAFTIKSKGCTEYHPQNPRVSYSPERVRRIDRLAEGVSTTYERIHGQRDPVVVHDRHHLTLTYACRFRVPDQ